MSVVALGAAHRDFVRAITQDLFYRHRLRRVAGSDDGTGAFLIEACTTILRQVIAIAPGVIATSEGDHVWKLRRGVKVLATFTATRVVAPP